MARVGFSININFLVFRDVIYTYRYAEFIHNYVFFIMRRIYLPLVILLSGSIFGPVNAESACDEYPRPGFDIKRDEKGGEKFIATAEVSVPIDDRDLYLDSMEEAEIEAKLKIAKFLNEEISGSTDIEKESKI